MLFHNGIKSTNGSNEYSEVNFLKEFDDIVKNNNLLRDHYNQFFDVSFKTNYVINGLNGKSINILQDLSEDELYTYKELKSNWQN